MKKTVTVITFILCLFLFGAVVNAASDFTLKSLDFEAKLNTDGSMEITEIWDIKINDETNTLFKTFKTDYSKYSAIENVKVSEVKDGEDINFKEIYSWVNHVSTDSYFGLKNSKGEFEIAWGVNKSSGNKKYRINYLVKNVIKGYSDVAELYWQFVGDEFEVESNLVTGTIILPQNTTMEDDVRVWAHGPLTGEIQRTDDRKVQFSVPKLPAKTMLEVRVTMPIGLFSITKSNASVLDKIVEEETVWADEANVQREMAQIEVQTIRTIIAAVSILISAFFSYRIYKNYKTYQVTEKIVPGMKVDYYREMPNENSTPGEAAFLYYFGKSGLANNLPKVLSSTMLDLCMKGYIEFEVLEQGTRKEEVLVILKEEKEQNNLKKHEKTIYELLQKVANSAKNSQNAFTMKDLEKYAKKNNTTFLSKIGNIQKQVEEKTEEEKNYDSKIKAKGSGWIVKGTLLISAAIVLFVIFIAFIDYLDVTIILLGIVTICILVGDVIICFMMSSKFNGLTQKGADEKELWEGLKRYMENFSMMDEKTVPELVLWEKYLVYATAFGIADKVLKQLKVKYPEFSDEQFLRNSTYMYLMAHSSFDRSIVSSINNSVSSAYKASIAASQASSGGGYGGGFSGGGGRRRSEVAGGGGR